MKRSYREMVEWALSCLTVTGDKRELDWPGTVVDKVQVERLGPGVLMFDMRLQLGADAYIEVEVIGMSHYPDCGVEAELSVNTYNFGQPSSMPGLPRQHGTKLIELMDEAGLLAWAIEGLDHL